jgi:hypothetical protein
MLRSTEGKVVGGMIMSTDGIPALDARFVRRLELERKLNIIPGRLAVWERHIAHLCHQKYLEGKYETLSTSI